MNSTNTWNKSKAPHMPANPCNYIFNGDDKQSFDILDTNSD